MEQLASFYYPSTVVVVDDNKKFLSQFSSELRTGTAFKLFNNPQEAIEYLKEHTNTHFAKEFLLENTGAQDDDLQSSTHQTKVDLSQLYKKVYDPKRFAEASVVVMDYAMPVIDGYQFCKLTADLPLRKIMLTAKANDSLAVQLFNQDLLHCFVKKELSEIKTINDLIYKQQQAYFEKQSKILKENLKAQEKFHLQVNAVKEVFKDFCKTNSIVEYYTIRANGCSLLVDFDGNPHWFIVMDEDELQDFVSIAEDHDAAPEIVEPLKAGIKIPFFNSNEELMEAQNKRWNNYLYPAKIIQNDNKKYYYCFVKDVDLLEFSRTRVSSFRSYLQNY